MSHVEQLERETEQTRAQVADTIDELKESMTPAHVLHQLADRMTEGAPAAFARNLKDQAVNNPLPIAFIGAGLAWLMLAPRNPGGSLANGSGERMKQAGEAAQQRAADATGAARETAGTIAGTLRHAAGDTADAADDAAGSMSDAAGSMSDSIQRTLMSGYGTTADTAKRTADTISESAGNVGRRAMQSGDAFIDFCRDQPMVVAGIGLAIGALVGALLPTSETENRLLGEASDRAKESAQNFARDKYEDAKKVGERAFDAAKDEAAKQADAQGETDRSDQSRTDQSKTGESRTDQSKTDKEEHPTLVPSDKTDESELERRGYPWTDDNSPV